MKNLFKSSMLVAIVAAALVGCSKDTTETNAPVVKGTTVYFKAEVADDTDGSRASLTPSDDEKLFSAAWEATDQIGISAESMTADDMQPQYDYNLCGTRENDVFSTTFQNCPESADLWYYYAYYPYTANASTDCNIVIPFGSARTQKGNAYNSAYDIMAADEIIIDKTAAAGEDAEGNPLVFAMHRLTAIAYFHFTTTAAANTDKVLSVTLSATPSEETEPLAADEVLLFYGDETETTKHSCVMYDKAANSIKITYDPATAPEAADFKAWFNVLPGIFSGVKVAIETENYTATITRTGDVLYEAGKLYKVSGKISDTKWTAKAPAEPVGPANGTILWSENWNNCEQDSTPKSNTEGTVVYNNGTINYTYVDGKSGTKIYADNLAGGTSPELLLNQKGSSSNGSWTISNIPTGNCSEATLTFKINKQTATYCTITSDTDNVTIGTLNSIEEATNKYTHAYLIKFNKVQTFSLTFTNSNSSNCRIDDIELVVGNNGPIPKASTPANLEVKTDADAGLFMAKWDSVTGVSEYAWRLVEDGATTDLKTGTTTDKSVTCDGLDTAKKYVLYVKSVGDGVNFKDSDEESINVSFSAGVTPVTDVLTADLFTATSSTYVTFSNVTVTSNAVYAGKTAKDSSGNIQLRSSNNDCGIVTTTSGGNVRKIVVTWASSTTTGRTLDIYGSNTAFTAASALYATAIQGTKIGSIVYGTSTTLEVTDDYKYIGLRSKSGAMYITKIEITYEN